MNKLKKALKKKIVYDRIDPFFKSVKKNVLIPILCVRSYLEASNRLHYYSALNLLHKTNICPNIQNEKTRKKLFFLSLCFDNILHMDLDQAPSTPSPRKAVAHLENKNEPECDMATFQFLVVTLSAFTAHRRASLPSAVKN